MGVCSVNPNEAPLENQLAVVKRGSRFPRAQERKLCNRVQRLLSPPFDFEALLASVSRLQVVVEIWGFRRSRDFYLFVFLRPLLLSMWQWYPTRFPASPLQLWRACDGCSVILAMKGFEGVDELYSRKLLAVA